MNVTELKIKEKLLHYHQDAAYALMLEIEKAKGDAIQEQRSRRDTKRLILQECHDKGAESCLRGELYNNPYHEENERAEYFAWCRGYVTSQIAAQDEQVVSKVCL
jgi:hypothetical protein